MGYSDLLTPGRCVLNTALDIELGLVARVGD